jgi:DNA invertase Pin-like site-specific DNA recombinase
MTDQSQLTTTDGDASRFRCAVYARFSSDNQSDTIEDQIRNCRVAAERNGWVVLEEYIRFDKALTGRTLAGRDGLADLLRLAKQHPKPFDCLLIDDTSRLGRYLPDVLRESDTLLFHGVFIYFVSDRLNTSDENSRIAHLVKGYSDERYSKDMGKKIFRGQEGKIRKGYTTGSSCYGYKNTYIRDPHQKGMHGEDKVIAVKQEIIPEQAWVIVRIMEMRASGFSFARIAKALKAEGVPAPQRKYNGVIRGQWLPSTIKEITRNELYHGVRVWNRTQKLLNSAEGGTKHKRTKPQSEWIRVDVPDLRIIPDQLWERVQQVNRQIKDKIYGRRLGGLNRSEQSRTYLFSDIMYCGSCDGKFAVIIGGKASKVRYGCKNHRFRDTCTNRVTIRWKQIEPQLISALAKNLLDPRLDEERIREFSKYLKARIELEEQLAAEASSNPSQLEAERSELEVQARRLVDAVAQHGYSSFLSAELARVESRLAEVERLLANKPTPKMPTFTDKQIRLFLRKECADFCEVLTSDPESARQQIRKRIKKLILTPKQTPEGWVLEVSGDIELLRSGDVLVQGALDETSQHYTRFCVVLAGVVLDPSQPLVA